MRVRASPGVPRPRPWPKTTRKALSLQCGWGEGLLHVCCVSSPAFLCSLRRSDTVVMLSKHGLIESLQQNPVRRHNCYPILKTRKLRHSAAKQHAQSRTPGAGLDGVLAGGLWGPAPSHCVSVSLQVPEATTCGGLSCAFCFFVFSSTDEFV